MRYFFLLGAILSLSPSITHAAGLEDLIKGFVGFLSDVVIPFLFAIAFLIFAFNVIRYFVFGSTSEEGRDNAKNLAIYSVLAFVVLVVFWGIVNGISSLLGFGGTTQPTADYIDPGSVKNSGIKQSPSNTSGTPSDEITTIKTELVPFDPSCEPGADFNANGEPCRGIY